MNTHRNFAAIPSVVPRGKDGEFLANRTRSLISVPPRDPPCPILPEDLVALASYYDISLDRNEYYLLAVMKDCVTSPVKYPWFESDDELGMKYVNSKTKEISRRHPLDHRYLHLTNKLRLRGPPPGPMRTWMEFIDLSDPNLSTYFYNFREKQRANVCPPHLIIEPVIRNLLPWYTTQVLIDKNRVENTKNRIVTTLAPHHGPSPKVMTYTCSWVEDEEDADLSWRTDGEMAGGGLRRRYLKIRHVPKSNTFSALVDCDDTRNPLHVPNVTLEFESASVTRFHPKTTVEEEEEEEEDEVAREAASGGGALRTGYRMDDERSDEVGVSASVLDAQAAKQAGAIPTVLGRRGGGGGGAVGSFSRGKASSSSSPPLPPPSPDPSSSTPPLPASRMQRAPADKWDLHVGAAIRVLGKRVTIAQADRFTVEWLEEHADHLTQFRTRVIREVQKYDQTKLPAHVTIRLGGSGRGGRSLRALLGQVGEALQRLGAYRPRVAEDMANELRKLGYPLPDWKKE